jgi:hypothetical protein
MQLEELQIHWQRLDQKLDRSLAVESELMRQLVVQPARRRVNRLAIWPAIDVVLSFVGLQLGAAFLRDYWGDWQLVAPACVVMIGLIALLADSIRQLVLVAQADWDGPVAAIQGSLEKLRLAKIRQFKWVILLAPLFGFCVLVVGVHWLLGWTSDDRARLLDQIDPWWIAINYAFGVLFVPMGYLLARALASRCKSRRWWQIWLDDISGKSLKAAARDIERWASLQHEVSNQNA